MATPIQIEQKLSEAEWLLGQIWNMVTCSDTLDQSIVNKSKDEMNLAYDTISILRETFQSLNKGD